jgi:hypothetical protein
MLMVAKSKVAAIMSTGADISPSPFLPDVPSINIQFKFNLQKTHRKSGRINILSAY